MKKTSVSKTAKKTVLEGVAVADGIAIGQAYVYDARKLSAPDYKISQEHTDAELARLKKAIADVVKETDNEIKAASPQAATMLKSYMTMLIDDKLVKSLYAYIADNLVNAEQAVSRVLDDIAAKLNGSEDDYLAERADDIHDIGVKIIQQLIGQNWQALDALPENTILLCDQLSVSDAVKVLPKKVLGFASQYGGVQGHTALLARAWGIPSLVAVDRLLDKAASGAVAIIDGQEGKIVINPGSADIAAYEKRMAEFQDARKALQDWVKKPPMTKDKVRVGVYANIDLMSNIPSGIVDGSDGIGLLRTEYLFLNKETPPSEDRQYLAIRNLVRKMRGKPVTVRLADIGADKSVDGRPGSQMGLRGIRYLLSRPDIMRPHIMAILRASRFGPVKIMLPTVCEVDDILLSKKMIKEIHSEMRTKGQNIPARIPQIGVMIETPAAALKVKEQAKHCAFFSLGTNDLVQYVLAADRNDPDMAGFYNPADLSVLRLIHIVAKDAADYGTPLAICGEIAADPKYTKLLIGLGLRDFSVTVPSIGGIKEKITELSAKDAKIFARKIMECSTNNAINNLLK